jgi:hypothetical protein
VHGEVLNFFHKFPPSQSKHEYQNSRFEGKGELQGLHVGSVALPHGKEVALLPLAVGSSTVAGASTTTWPSGSPEGLAWRRG